MSGKDPRRKRQQRTSSGRLYYLSINQWWQMIATLSIILDTNANKWQKKNIYDVGIQINLVKRTPYLEIHEEDYFPAGTTVDGVDLLTPWVIYQVIITGV